MLSNYLNIWKMLCTTSRRGRIDWQDLSKFIFRLSFFLFVGYHFKNPLKLAIKFWKHLHQFFPKKHSILVLVTPLAVLTFYEMILHSGYHLKTSSAVFTSNVPVSMRVSKRTLLFINFPIHCKSGLAIWNPTIIGIKHLKCSDCSEAMPATMPKTCSLQITGRMIDSAVFGF